MKTPEDENVKILEEGLAQIGIDAGPGVLERFMLYLEELKKWNRAYNLTAIKDDWQIIIKHFLDSALYLKAIEKIAEKGRVQTLADVGSGAGFPGVVLKLLRPALAVCLIEPSWKRAAFLRHVASRLDFLGPGLTVFEGKAEEMRPPVPFDIAVTRALWKAPDFVEKARGIVRHGGWFIMSKGPAYAAELNDMDRREGGFEAIRLKLPFTDALRFIIIINHDDQKQDHGRHPGPLP